MTTNEKIKNIIENRELAEYFNVYLTTPYNVLLFTEFFFEVVKKQKFSCNWHHGIVCEKLNEILNYTHKTNHLIINIPPRMTKTELAVISFISYGFAINPGSEFMHFSSSDSLVTRNTTFVRTIMESSVYRSIFPRCALSNNAKGSITTTKGGVLYAAPFLGQITGFGCGKFGSDSFAGAMVIDDPMKTQDCESETIREKVNFTWANTLISRKNDQRTPVIVIGQRVHEKDFCGFLIEEEGTIEEGGKWDVLSIPAIIDEGLETERSLWENRISLENLKKQKSLDEWVFNTQYQQHPTAIEGLMFHHSTTKYYDELPSEPDYIHVQIDPADCGEDFLASIVFYIKDEKVFIADIIYDKSNTDVTIPRILDQLKNSGAASCVIESNSGWALFRKSIKAQAEEMGISTAIRSINNHDNKELRVFNQAPYIIRNFYYPKTGNNEYNLYMKHKHSYLKIVKSQKDDGVDCEASACAWLKKNGIISIV